MRLVDVALPLPLARAFTYLVPGPLETAVAEGARLVCTLGSRRVIGVALAVRDGDPPPNVKPILAVVDDEPAVPADLLAFLRDVAQYYLAPIGEVVRLALPPVERAVARAVDEPTLFTKGRGVGPRRVQWVTAVEAALADGATDASPEGTTPAERAEPPPRLGSQAAAILAHVRALGATPLARLEAKWPNARGAVKRLREQSLVNVEERDAIADPFFAEPVARDSPPAPTRAQDDAIATIVAAIDAKAGGTFLLHGVTGSGKTEVYLRAIAAARAARVGTIVLVPEIALTPQLVGRFRARFGDDVAVLHSALTPRERHAMWRRLHGGEVDVVIGARSAIFAPVRALGLVLVDEEHDSSFKQEEGVRYHARDMAILRAHRVAGVCVLGSATPSLETEQLVRSGKARKIVLPDRARAQPLPRVEIVDLRAMGAGPTGSKRITLPLHRAIEATLAAKEQAILFLNRRGFSPSVRCEACGKVAECPSCSVALTFHKRGGVSLRCHYCDFETPMPKVCSACSAPALALEGLGTEKLEEVLAGAFPEARIARLDRDVASGRDVEKILSRVRAREVDILVGTQMVTKGHDLPHVTLVGVVNADAALSIPDFRAAERAFQILVQVAGRAGRGDAPGRVLVQTYTPEHHAIVFAAKHDVDGFLARELVDRRELAYPPFSRIALVRVDGPDEGETRAACALLAACARKAAAEAAAGGGAAVEVLGPAAAPIARVRNRFRFRLMVRSRDRAMLRRTLIAVERSRAESLPRAVRAIIDVDPVQFL